MKWEGNDLTWVPKINVGKKILLKDRPPGGGLSGSLVGPWGSSSAPANQHDHAANFPKNCNQIPVESLGTK